MNKHLSLTLFFLSALSCFAQEFTVPYTQNFDTTDLCVARCGVPCNVGNEWTNVGQRDWLVWTGSTPSDLTGPDSDASGNGNYIFIEASDECEKGIFELLSPVFDLTSSNCPIFSFSRHARGLNMGEFKVLVKEVGTATWNQVFRIREGIEKNVPWTVQELYLSEYAGKKIQIKFYFKTTGSPKSDFALDEIHFVNDGRKPNVTCPSDFTVNADADACGTLITVPSAIGSDNCNLVSVTASVSLNTPTLFPVGQTSVTYTATDLSGNDSSCVTIITVEDKIAPVFSDILDIQATVPVNACSLEVTIPLPTINENCTVASANFTDGVNTYTFGQTITLTPGIYTMHANVVDIYGNFSNRTFFIQVLDAGVPTISCPDSVKIANDLNACSAFYALPEPLEIADANLCGGSLTVSTSLGNVGREIKFNVGTTNVVYTVADVSGNTASCNLVVLVEDVQKPEFYNIPADIVTCDRAVRWSVPSLKDNCLVSVKISRQFKVDDLLTAGATTSIRYTATDTFGNETVFVHKITVAERPMIVIDEITPTDSKKTRDGAIEVSFTKGTPPYVWTWSTGDQSEDVRNLPWGFYNLGVVDANGCSDFVNLFIPYRYNKNLIATEFTADMVTVYPNPASTSLTIEGAVENFEYRIVDIFGKTAPIVGRTTSRTETIDVSNLASGQYIIQFNNAEYGISESRKIVIIH